MLLILFDIEGNVHKEFFPAGQTVNSAYYCDVYGDCVNMCEHYSLNVATKNSLLLHNSSSHTLFSSGNFFFTKSIMTVVHHPLYFSLFLKLRIKLKGRHFDTIVALVAESQAVLNFLTEHDLQHAFKNGRSAWNGAFPRKGNDDGQLDQS
jgi:hypothetical protein